MERNKCTMFSRNICAKGAQIEGYNSAKNELQRKITGAQKEALKRSTKKRRST